MISTSALVLWKIDEISDLNKVYGYNFLAFEIFDEKRSVSSPPSTVVRTTKTDLSTNIRSKSPNYSPDESSISEEISLHRKETEPLVDNSCFFVCLLYFCLMNSDLKKIMIYHRIQFKEDNQVK
jgi:hypothetical protein